MKSDHCGNHCRSGLKTGPACLREARFDRPVTWPGQAWLAVAGAPS